MGLMHLPRAYFKGSMYWNPSTMNNNDYQPTYDPASARLDWGWMERHGIRSSEDFDRYATQPAIIATPNSGANDAVFPNCPPAEWNYHGGNTCGFVGEYPRLESPMFSKPNDPAIVTGYTNAAGDYVASDALVGAPLHMNAGMAEAKLIDVDPICPWSSQIFVDSISVGDAASGIGFAARTGGRAHARWLNFFRNVSGAMMIAGRASTVFQVGLPRDSITFFSGKPEPGSLVAQLARALEGPGVQGLMVRFVAYNTIYFQGDAFQGVVRDPNQPPQFSYFPVMARLYAEYAQRYAAYTRGEIADPPPPPVNRAYSKTVGWIAPWMSGELRSMPGGRNVFSVVPPSPRSLGPIAIECAPNASAPDQVERLTVDLGSAMPEADGIGTKKDLGTLQIGLVPLDGTGAPQIVARIPYAGGYDQSAYEQTSGVVEIPAARFEAPLSVADAQSKRFCISLVAAGGTASTASLESAFVAQTDERGVYVNEPNAPWRSDPAQDLHTMAIQVRYLGGAPPAGTQLAIVQYSPNPPNFNEGGLAIVSSDPASPLQSPYLELIGQTNAAGDGYVVMDVPPPNGGEPYSAVSIDVRGVRPGCPVLGFHPLAPGRVCNPPPSVSFPDISALFYAVVRVLPFHNLMAQAFEDWLDTGPMIDLVTQRVFDEVFKTYYLMYPAMRFMRDPLQFQAWRGPVCEVTDPSRFESATYMPATRSLSAGQRRILELWNAYADGQIPTLPQPFVAIARRA